MTDAYGAVRFNCPTCGQRLSVERCQVDRREVVTCATCNTDLLLSARGVERAVAEPDRLTGDVPIVVVL